MSIPYYTITPGSQKNALISDNRPKYWLSTPAVPGGQFQTCYNVCVIATGPSSTLNGWSMRGSQFLCCTTVLNHDAPVALYNCNTETCFGRERMELLRDQCYLTTYKVPGLYGSECIDEFGVNIGPAQRSFALDVSSCGYTMGGITVCKILDGGFTRINVESTNDANMYFLADGTVRGLCCNPCGWCNAAEYLGAISWFPQSSMITNKTCTTLSTRFTCTDISISGGAGMAAAGFCYEHSCTTCSRPYWSFLHSPDDVLAGLVTGCTTCRIIRTLLTPIINSGCASGYCGWRSPGAGFAVNNSTQEFYTFMGNPHASTSNYNCCNFGYLIKGDLPRNDCTIANCYNSDCCTLFKKVIALPSTLAIGIKPSGCSFDQCPSLNFTDHLCYVMGNSYNRLDYKEDRYWIINGTTENTKAKILYLNMNVPAPMLFDETTSVMKTFLGYCLCTCCSSATLTCINHHYGHLAYTSRNTFLHAWACCRRLVVNEYCLDGTNITGACYSLYGPEVPSNCGNQYSVEMMYDCHNDALIVKWMRFNCVQNQNYSNLTTQPEVWKLPTNTLSVCATVRARSCHAGLSCPFACIGSATGCTRCQMGMYDRTLEVGCSVGTTHCVICCTIPDNQIRCGTEGCYGGYVSEACWAGGGVGCADQKIMWVCNLVYGKSICCPVAAMCCWYCCSDAALYGINCRWQHSNVPWCGHPADPSGSIGGNYSTNFNCRVTFGGRVHNVTWFEFA